MRAAARRRLAVSATTLALLGVVAACGGESSKTEDGATDSASASEDTAGESVEYPFDLTDPGDDLLDRVRRGVVIAGTDTEVSWRFPEGYETTSEKQATAKDGDIDLDIGVGAKPGAAPDDEAQAIAEGADAENEAETYDVTVGDRPFSVVTLSSKKQGLSLTAFFHSSEKQSATYAVIFTAGAPLDEVPEERLDELHQTVASLEFEPRDN